MNIWYMDTTNENANKWRSYSNNGDREKEMYLEAGEWRRRERDRHLGIKTMTLLVVTQYILEIPSI